ncbi:SseB family protein [bacterium]|nr:SseB family protein [bacterium]NBX83763.1 SseB family protein [bacterium]
MTDLPKAETPLDEALASAFNDQKFANFFYDTFLNTVIFMPVKKEGTQEGSFSELTLKDRFFPYFLNFEKGRAIPVFDQLKRMEGWGQSFKFDYIKIKAHLLLKLLDPSMAVVINPGTAFEYILTSEILTVLRQSMKPVSPA